ncbi:MAG: hypothetical protein E6J79_09945 [Deltaproteobacteria bacterium]|nr:MAG: hypothetical protein E6J79_09945 [Deltaproteobacteria bacterium]
MAAALTTLAAALLVYVLGRSTLPVFVGRTVDPPRPVLQLELLLGNALLSVIGLLLAETGHFALRWLVAISILVCGIGFGLRASRPRDSGTPSYDIRDAVGMGLLIAAYLWAFPAFDTSLFGLDSSLYLASGLHIAEHGSLVIHDPTLALLPPAERVQWFPLYHPETNTPPFLRVGGGLLLPDLASDRVLPAFQPLLSVWVAIFYAIGGDQAIAAPITYFGALFLWAFATFTAGLAGPWAAGLALGLLTSLVPQYWYSRFPMPEIPSEYFLWAGLWAGSVSLSSGARRLGALSGLAVGVAGLMRLDMLIHVAAALALWTAVAPRQRWPGGRGFAPALLLMTAYALVHQVLFPSHYFAEMSPRLLIVRDYLRSHHLLSFGVAGFAVLAVAMAALMLTESGLADGASVLRAALRLAALAAFATYAVTVVATAWPDLATNLAWLRLYAGWPLGLAAAIGVPLWIRRARNPAERFVLVFGLLATAQLFFYPPVSPQPLWAIRRFLRIALPTGAIAAALALTSLVERRRWVLAVAALALMLALGPRSAFTFRQPAYQNTMAYVRSIGAQIPRGAVIVGDPAFFAESQLHIALWITRDAPAFFLDGPTTESLRRLRTALRDRPMIWIGPTGRPPPAATGNLRLVRMATYTFSVATRRMEPYDERDDLGLREISLAMYRVDLDPS